MKVIVVGGGKVGYYLAKTLLEHGHQPHIIEINKKICANLAEHLELAVYNGDGTTLEGLSEADAATADVLVSVTGRDEDNLIACQLAKRHFSVPKTVARVNNPRNLEVMKALGVDIPISSTDNIARLLEREVDTSRIRQLMALNRGEASIIELLVPQNYALDGITLSELRLPQDCVICTITRDDTLLIPRGNTTILSGDRILVIAKDTIIHDLTKMLRLE